MKVKFKKLVPEAKVPSYANPGDAAVDLTAISMTFNNERQYWEYGTGLAIEIPDSHVGLIFPRSSVSNTDLSLCNAVGVIDSKYRGEIMLRFKEWDNLNGLYEVGDRIGQLIILPYSTIKFEEVNELSGTERGTNGFGSSGK